MNLPIRFPNQADVIRMEAEAFRRQTPTERFLCIVDLIASGTNLMNSSPHREEAARWREAEEKKWERIHRELFAGHGD